MAHNPLYPFLLKQAAVTSGAEAAAQTGFSPWQIEAIALGYQSGVLILPSLAPVVLWLWLDRGFIAMLEGALRLRKKTTAHCLTRRN